MLAWAGIVFLINAVACFSPAGLACSPDSGCSRVLMLIHSSDCIGDQSNFQSQEADQFYFLTSQPSEPCTDAIVFRNTATRTEARNAMLAESKKLPCFQCYNYIIMIDGDASHLEVKAGQHAWDLFHSWLLEWQVAVAQPAPAAVASRSIGPVKVPDTLHQDIIAFHAEAARFLLPYEDSLGPGYGEHVLEAMAFGAYPGYVLQLNSVSANIATGDTETTPERMLSLRAHQWAASSFRTLDAFLTLPSIRAMCSQNQTAKPERRRPENATTYVVSGDEGRFDPCHAYLTRKCHERSLLGWPACFGSDFPDCAPSPLIYPQKLLLFLQELFSSFQRLEARASVAGPGHDLQVELAVDKPEAPCQLQRHPLVLQVSWPPHSEEVRARHASVLHVLVAGIPLLPTHDYDGFAIAVRHNGGELTVAALLPFYNQLWRGWPPTSWYCSPAEVVAVREFRFWLPKLPPGVHRFQVQLMRGGELKREQCGHPDEEGLSFRDRFWPTVACIGGHPEYDWGRLKPEPEVPKVTIAFRVANEEEEEEMDQIEIEESASEAQRAGIDIPDDADLSHADRGDILVDADDDDDDSYTSHDATERRLHRKTPTKDFLYLVQSDVCIHLPHLRTPRSHVLQLTWKSPCPDALFLPNSSLVQGRNRLFAAAQEPERFPGLSFRYYILLDGDVLLTEVADFGGGADTPWRTFERYLDEWEPAVGVPHFGVMDYDPRAEVQLVYNFDQIVVAVHAEAAPLLLPYEERFDAVSWWYCGAVQNALAAAQYNEHRLQFNALRALSQTNNLSPTYKRGSNFNHPLAWIAPAIASLDALMALPLHMPHQHATASRWDAAARAWSTTGAPKRKAGPYTLTASSHARFDFCHEYFRGRGLYALCARRKSCGEGRLAAESSVLRHLEELRRRLRLLQLHKRAASEEDGDGDKAWEEQAERLEQRLEAFRCGVETLAPASPSPSHAQRSADDEPAADEECAGGTNVDS